jgi:hypothetical protein
MRYIAVFLLLLNIGYFGWNQFHREPQNTLPAPQSRELLNTGLMMVSEFNAQSAEQAQRNAEFARVCYFVGAFPSVDDANSFIAISERRGLSGQLRLTGAAIAPRYRVFLAPVPSRSIAIGTLEEMSANISQAGLQIEADIIRRGSLENAIALGVYQQRQDASRVLQQVSELGYSLEIEEIPQSTGEIQVLLRSLADIRIEDIEWKDLTADSPYLDRTENVCETIAQGGQFP